MKKMWSLTGIALLLVVALLPAQAAVADVQDFSIRSFEADYHLTRDAAKRSQLRVIEKIDAQFPAYDQNHGLERAIPNRYDGHKVSFSLKRVVDGSGKELPYTTYDSHDNTVVRIGDPESYVHGLQVYQIEYTLRDVTKGFSNHDELYWDINGTGWWQSFDSVTARLHLDEELAAKFSDRTRCFVGAAGSTEQCDVSENQGDGELVLTYTSGRRLGPGENVTLVAGFEKETFAPYEPTAWERALPGIVAVSVGLNLLLLVVIIIFVMRATRRHGRAPKGKPTTVPEYIPPKGMSVLISAVVLHKTAHAATAQLIDLAVRHYVKIYEIERRIGWFGKRRNYELELSRELAKLTAEEQQLATMVFGQNAAVGTRLALDSLKTQLRKQNIKLLKDIQRAAEEQGYFADRAAQRKKYYWKGGMLLLGGLITLMPGVVVGGIIMLAAAATWRPLTQKGVDSRDYLQGLKKYMKLAEADRLTMLQSPKGALRAINTGDKKQLIKLYERLLPYAILFGIEKEWVKQFAPLYEQPPDWYSGNYHSFNTGAFSASLTSFASDTNRTFAPPASSSSSGFSGGGSSGGGGGGGGGGGW